MPEAPNHLQPIEDFQPSVSAYLDTTPALRLLDHLEGNPGCLWHDLAHSELKVLLRGLSVLGLEWEQMGDPNVLPVRIRRGPTRC